MRWQLAVNGFGHRNKSSREKVLRRLSFWQSLLIQLWDTPLAWRAVPFNKPPGHSKVPMDKYEVDLPRLTGTPSVPCCLFLA
jgi:hypothetical protein